MSNVFGMYFQDFSYHAVCSAISLISKRFENLLLPVKSNFYYDLIGELGGKLFKIKVVHTTCKQPSGAYIANLRKSGGYLAKKEYKEKFASPFVAASRGYIDDVIRPQNTRWRICRSLSILKNKNLQNPWKKHDNLPL